MNHPLNEHRVLRRLLTSLTCGVFILGGTFVCRSGDDDDDDRRTAQFGRDVLHQAGVTSPAPAPGSWRCESERAPRPG